MNEQSTPVTASDADSSPLRGDHPGFAEARDAAAVLAEATGAAEHRIAVVLGSGWGEAAELIGTERARVDNYYIENWSLWLDVKILLISVGTVLFGRGGR